LARPLSVDRIDARLAVAKPVWPRKKRDYGVKERDWRVWRASLDPKLARDFMGFVITQELIERQGVCESRKNFLQSLNQALRWPCASVRQLLNFDAIRGGLTTVLLTTNSRGDIAAWNC
jgi:hypothetical protein